jgi:hypothetical protein
MNFFLIKHEASGQYLVGIDNDGYGVFSDNYNGATWGYDEEYLNSWVASKNLSHVSVQASTGGDHPPTPPQVP